jgi:hypothetical protein
LAAPSLGEPAKGRGKFRGVGRPQLHAKTPVTVHVEVVEGAEVPRNSGIFASDPLWQPMTSEPFIEVFIRRRADGKIVTKQLQTKVDIECKWRQKFVLPVPFTMEKAAEYWLVFRLCDYRRFTEHVVMGEAELDVLEIQLHDGNSVSARKVEINESVSYFDVSKTSIEVKAFIPASALPAQPAEIEDLAAAQEAAPDPPKAETARVDEGVQTDASEGKPAFAWAEKSNDTEELQGHIPWIYEKWHHALNAKRMIRNVR